MSDSVEDIRRRLRKVDLALQKSVFLTFGHFGESIPEPIKQLKTDNDVIELAREITDCNVPGTNNYEEFYRLDNENMKDDMEEMVEERKELDEMHEYQTKTREECEKDGDDEYDDRHSSEEPRQTFNAHDEFFRIVGDLGFNPEWLTLNAFIKDLGYLEPQEKYPFEVNDVIEVLYENFEEDIELYETFMTGEMDVTSIKFMSVMSDLIGTAGDGDREEFQYAIPPGVEEYTPEFEARFFAQEEDDEAEEELEQVRAMCIDTFKHIQEELIFDEECNLELFEYLSDNEDGIMTPEEEVEYEQLRADMNAAHVKFNETWKETVFHEAQDLDQLKDLYDRIEDEYEYVEELKVETYKKRNRDHFDEEAVKTEFVEGTLNSDIAEIKFEQQQTDLVFNPTAFKRLCQEIVQDFVEREDCYFEPSFYEALQVASEDMLIKRFENSNLSAINAERTHIQPRDMQLVARIEGVSM
jgi:histone H3